MPPEEQAHDPFQSKNEAKSSIEEADIDVASFDECPISEADDRYQEAHYFLSRMMDTYHRPNEFRWNLNAFIQALRNVTFVIQKLLAHETGFEEWYSEQQEMMKQDDLLRKFLEGRNIVVKQRNLDMESKAEIGIFRYRETKLGISVPVPTWVDSEKLLTERAPLLGLLDPHHMAIGEEYGVKREWIAPELGDKNVLSLCDEAWVRIADVLFAAHEFIGRESSKPDLHGHNPEMCNLLTETDLDPSLPAVWGWTD